MNYYLSTIKDIIGNNYIGIKIDGNSIQNFLNELKDILESEFEKYNNLQQQRDGNSYHITVMNVIEYNKLTKEMGVSNFIKSLDLLFSYPIDDLKMMGLGKAKKNENISYFVVCKSDKLDAVRNKYNLPNKDFHITIGFLFKDVFGVPKNIILPKKSKFIKLLKTEWIENENFNFIKKCQNYDLDPSLEITPISISDDFLKIKVGEFIMDVGLYDNNKFRIFTKYKDTKNLERIRIPTSELLEYLNKK